MMERSRVGVEGRLLWVVADEPTANAAAERMQRWLELLSASERLPEQSDMVTSNFVLDDRRTLGIGQVERDVAMTYAAAAWDVNPARPRLHVDKLVATRGDRLALAKVDAVQDGWEDPHLMLWRLRPNLRDLDLAVMLDSGDLDAAIAELDRLHVEIEAADGKPPTP